jgi:AhpD family alkylhydroperoxidase
MRLDYRQVAPKAVQAMRELEAYVKSTGLEPSLLELVKIRASQLNGCAYCIDLHTRNARAAGEAERRIYALSAWRETPFFSARERAALAWAEAVTLLAESRVPDDVYEEARRHFTERELVDLTMAVVAINGWNRLAVAFRLPSGGEV